MTTFSGYCFDDFNKGYNQLVFDYLMVTNEHTIIPTCHKYLSSLPRHHSGRANCMAVCSWLFLRFNLGGGVGSRDGQGRDAERERDAETVTVPRFPEIHLAPESAFQAPPGHISSRDGIDLCPSSVPNPSRQRSRAHLLAR